MATSNEQQIYDYLTQVEGFSAAGAAAALGSFQVETGGTFSPTAYNPNEGAIGIAQWELGRRNSLDLYAASQGTTETSLTAQLGYLGRELAGPFSSVWSAMKSATNPVDAAAIWDADYEESSGDARQQRENNAAAIYATVSKGGKLTGGGGILNGQFPNSSIKNEGGGLNPLNGLGDAVSGVLDATGLSGWQRSVITWGTKIAFVGGAIVLVLIGASQTVKSANGGAMPVPIPV